MPYVDSSLISCGVHLMHDLAGDPAVNVGAVLPGKTTRVIDIGRTTTRQQTLDRGIVVWSDAVVYGRGQRLADFIAENKLGVVMASPVVMNPNSGRDIVVWTWAIDHVALNAWGQAQKEKAQATP